MVNMVAVFFMSPNREGQLVRFGDNYKFDVSSLWLIYNNNKAFSSRQNSQ